jgi:EAL domain-containing protein (putative c-di-GMP-specific phosphodiesterase class I)
VSNRRSSTSALGLSVVAEGVESLQSWHQLAAIGCDIAQGHHVGRPEPAAQIVARVLADREAADAGPRLRVVS